MKKKKKKAAEKQASVSWVDLGYTCQSGIWHVNLLPVLQNAPLNKER